MLVDGAGQLIVDVMTANRSLSGIPSASAILDTSNYTFQAISYGKDADGFRNHAHTILSPSSNGIIKVVSYESTYVSSYHTSATASALEDTYKLLPQSPSPLDTRLERKSTIPNYSTGVADAGQCLNPLAVTASPLFNYGHLIGCFPAASGTKFWFVSSASNPEGSLIFSGTLSSTYNEKGLMDASGFLTFAPSGASGHFVRYGLGGDIAYASGALRVPSGDWPSEFNLVWYLPSGDAGSLLLFGGLYEVGLWYLDLKELLKQGIYPPYSFNALNNKRKYKLFAKQVLNKDLLYLNDYHALGPIDLSGFKIQFTNDPTYNSAAWGGVPWAIGFFWTLKFTGS